jgi:ornithine--oxo-acid transaminase
LAAAVGLVALRVIEEEGLVERARDLGAHMMKRLQAIKSPAIRAVRGKGLLAGIDIEPRYADARTVCELLLAAGVLSKETHETVVRLAPPLVIAREDLDWALDRIAETIHAIERTPHPEAA